jgi:NADH-quinone oxidoreductase subunit N
LEVHWLQIEKKIFILFGSFFIQCNCETVVTTSLLSNDIGTLTIKKAILFFSVPLTIVMGRSFAIQKLNFAEFFTLFLLSILGIFFLVSSCDFVVSYLALEMQALCFYVLASFRRSSSFSTDAGLKYFVLGSFVSCLYLMGCLLIYGGMGTLNFNALTLLLSFPIENYSVELERTVFVGIFLIVASLMFKLAAAPFYYWAPDVYEGSPLASTIGFSILPKIGLLYFFFKCLNLFGVNSFYLEEFFIVSGFFSIIVGTYLAIKQTRLKRFTIYSSISQTGFFILALGLGTYESFCAMFLYGLIYIGSSILLWGYLAEFYSSQKKMNNVEEEELKPIYLVNISNFFARNQLGGLLFVGLLFSIAGMPPSAGFLAKIEVLRSLVESNHILLSILIVLVSSISFFYYLRIIKIVFFEIEGKKSSRETFHSTFRDSFTDLFYLLLILGLFGLYLFFFSPEFPLLLTELIVLGTRGY